MLDITESEFEKIKNIMHKKTGVFLKPTKKPLIVTRLRKHLEDLKMTSFSAYISLLESSNPKEFEFFINAITTNETYLFRHAKQFSHLSEVVLPEIVKAKQQVGSREIKIWSAASSTGEEPYSLAILCDEFKKKSFPSGNFKIYASDVNSSVLAIAKEARYPERSFREAPANIKGKYFKEIKQDNMVNKVVYELDEKVKKSVEFKQHNLLEAFSVRNMDIVFLRNVMIYFDNDVKQKVVSLIQDNVVDNGYLFISLSESLNDIKSKFSFVQSGIYKKKAN